MTNDGINSSRLSLALESLPLTPIGMKSPSSTKKKSLKEGGTQNKLSLRRLKLLQESNYLSTPCDSHINTEHLVFPLNVENVNTRRRFKGKKYRGKENNATNEINSGNRAEVGNIFDHTHIDLCSIKEKDESAFTDIDEGSFVEFTSSHNLPTPPKILPHFYYSCLGDNETKYSTSSKSPNALVGFHKFINAVKNQKPLSCINEELFIKEQGDVKLFRVNDTIIAGSYDILSSKNKENVNRLLNSTEYSFNPVNDNKLPDISSLTLHSLSDRQKRKSHVPQDESIVLSNSDENDIEVINIIPKRVLPLPSQHHEHWNKQDYLSESYFTEDISILPSSASSEEPENIRYSQKVPDSRKLRKEKCFVSPVMSKNMRFNGEINDNSHKDERVAGWVKNSPFKEGSFGSSFMCDKPKLLKHTDINCKSPTVTHCLPSSKGNDTQNLPNGHQGSEGSAHTVFTLERVAESPRSNDIIECILPNLSPLLKKNVKFDYDGKVSHIKSFKYKGNKQKNNDLEIQNVFSVTCSDSEQSYKKPSNKMCSPENTFSKSLDGKEINPLPHPIIIYNSDSDEMASEVMNDFIISDIDDFHLKLTVSSIDDKHNKKKLSIDDKHKEKSSIGDKHNEKKLSIYDKHKEKSSIGDKHNEKKLSINDKHKEKSLIGDKHNEKHISNDFINHNKLSTKVMSNDILASNQSKTYADKENLSPKHSNFVTSKSSNLQHTHRNTCKSFSYRYDQINIPTSPLPNLTLINSPILVTQLDSSLPNLNKKSETSTNSYHLHLSTTDSICITDSSPKRSDHKIVPNINLQLLTPSNNSQSKPESVDKANSILKSKSSTHINTLYSQILSSDDSLSHIQPRNSLGKSQSMKHLVANDSEGENSFQNFRRKELESVLKLRQKIENIPKCIYESKSVQKLDFSRKPPYHSGSQSVISMKGGKLQLESEVNEIPKFSISASDTSDDNFEEYLKNAKKKMLETNKKKVCSQDSESEFIVSDSYDEDASFSPPQRVFRQRNTKIPESQTQSVSDSIVSETDEDTSSSPSQRVFRRRNRKKTQSKTQSTQETKTPDNKTEWRIRQRILSSSSDSEEEKYIFRKTKKTPKPRVPKQTPTSVINKGVLKSDKTLHPHTTPQTLSFLSSLTLDTSLSKAHLDAIPFIKNFKKQKDTLVQKLYSIFNAHVFGNLLPPSMKITWNSRMTKTAGFCYYQMDKSKPSGRGARIELSSKVIDAPGRLRDTLIHELCHAASWMISGYKDGHGPLWKSWANKAMKSFPELPFISRCHSYEVNCKYTYKCSNCSYSIGRHSKSLDTEKKVCGYCYGKFVLLVNSAPNRNPKISSDVGRGAPKIPTTPRAPNPFSLYVKENYGSVKKSRSSLKHKDIMRVLSEEFAKLKTKSGS